MELRAVFNRILFEQTDLDSGALTMLGSIIHNFSVVGEYIGTVLRGDSINKETKPVVVGRFRLQVDAESTQMQINVDLRSVEMSQPEHFESEQANRYIVNPKGYTQFYVSHGAGGYAVLVERFGFGKEQGKEKEGNAKVIFDSRELQVGTIFASSIIRPGRYSTTNLKTGSVAQLVLEYPEVYDKSIRYRQLDPVSIDSTKKGFVPDKVKVKSGQGQLFHIRTPTRIRIQLREPEDRLRKRYLKPRDVPKGVAGKVLKFLNSAKNPEDIANAVEFPKERDVGLRVAQNILDERGRRGRFTSLVEVYRVRQVGPERFTEMVESLKTLE